MTTPEPTYQTSLHDAGVKNAYDNGDFDYINKANEGLKRSMPPIADLFTNHGPEYEKLFNIVKDDNGHDVAVITTDSATFFGQVKEDSDAREAARKEGKKRRTLSTTLPSRLAMTPRTADEVKQHRREPYKIPHFTIRPLHCHWLICGSVISRALSGQADAAVAKAAGGLRELIVAQEAAEAILGQAALRQAERVIAPAAWGRIVGVLARCPQSSGSLGVA